MTMVPTNFQRRSFTPPPQNLEDPANKRVSPWSQPTFQVRQEHPRGPETATGPAHWPGARMPGGSGAPVPGAFRAKTWGEAQGSTLNNFHWVKVDGIIPPYSAIWIPAGEGIRLMFCKSEQKKLNPSQARKVGSLQATVKLNWQTLGKDPAASCVFK